MSLNVNNCKQERASYNIGVCIMSKAKNYAKITNFEILDKYCWDFDNNILYNLNAKDLKYKYNIKIDTNNFIIMYTNYSIILQKK